MGMSITEEIMTAGKTAEEKSKRAIKALSKIDVAAMKLDAILDCQIDFLYAMNFDGIDDAYHEKLIALTEISSGIVKEIREAVKDSPVA